MKTVLCFGDSNTWGAATVVRPDQRYAYEERWPGVLQASLGADWLVIEEGLGGRTTVSDDPVERDPNKNGALYLPPCLHTHKPLDVVAIMLGTNDMKARFNKSAWDIAQGVGTLIALVKSAVAVGRNGGVPRILVICPPIILDELPMHADLFAGGPAKSREIARHYKAVADLNGAAFLDAGSVIKSSKVDGFHFDPDAHVTLGKAVAEIVAKLA